MKISVVMPSFNQASYVEAAINSVLDQADADYEILFVDGGSTDGTMDIVERYRHRLTVCVSEPDKGQSDALRKGFERARGEILTWLNTDDLLLPGALSEVAREFQRKPVLSWALGNVIWIDANDTILKCWRGESYTPGLMRLGAFAAGGPSAFFKRELYNRVGGINLDLHYQMDTELWWRFAMAGERYHRLKTYTWALRLHENAKVSGAMFADANDEKQQTATRCKVEEARQISRLTSKYRLPIHHLLSRQISGVRRALSPRFLAGYAESRRFRGHNLDTLILQSDGQD